MRRILTLVSATAAVVAITSAFGAAARDAASSAAVTAHCSAGQRGAFVTPVRVEIALGDSVVWRMAGNVASDSIIITPKDPEQAWPFAGAPPRGGAVARANAARRTGTYGYNVTLYCRVPGGGTRREVIDPDIIIGE